MGMEQITNNFILIKKNKVNKNTLNKTKLINTALYSDFVTCPQNKYHLRIIDHLRI